MSVTRFLPIRHARAPLARAPTYLFLLSIQRKRMWKSRMRGGRASSSSALARSPLARLLARPLDILRIVGRQKNPATSAYDAAGIAYCLRRAKELKWRDKSTHRQYGLYRISFLYWHHFNLCISSSGPHVIQHSGEKQRGNYADNFQI